MHSLGGIQINLMEGSVMKRINSSQVRSLLKACSWRVVASLDTMLLVWLVTGSLETGAAIGIIEIVTKIFIYYGHERLWDKVKVKVIRKTLNKVLPDSTKVL